MTVCLERKYRFSASHRYHRPEWTAEENLSRFGKCSWAPGHGHNYQLEIGIEGEPDRRTGFVLDLTWLDREVTNRILDRLDHRHINSALEGFADGAQVPTCENLVLWIREQLEDLLPAACRLRKVRLSEDEFLAAVWLAGGGDPEFP